MESQTISDLVQKMIMSLCGEQKPDVVRNFLRFSLNLLSSTQGLETVREDETTIAAQIRGKLSAKDAVQFDKLHNDLKDGNGSFLLRIEDTDQARVVSGAMEHLHDNLLKQIEKLLDNGTAYRCFCTERRLELIKREASRIGQKPKYDNRCRSLSKETIKEKLDIEESYCIRFKKMEEEKLRKKLTKLRQEEESLQKENAETRINLIQRQKRIDELRKERDELRAKNAALEKKINEKKEENTRKKKK